MPRKKNASRAPTMTSLVREALALADDFMTSEQIAAAVGPRPRNTLSQTLAWLKRMRVVDCVESEGRLWWFLTGDDARRRGEIRERAEEEEGSRGGRRRPRVPKD